MAFTSSFSPWSPQLGFYLVPLGVESCGNYGERKEEENQKLFKIRSLCKFVVNLVHGTRAVHLLCCSGGGGGRHPASHSSDTSCMNMNEIRKYEVMRFVRFRFSDSILCVTSPRSGPISGDSGEWRRLLFDFSPVQSVNAGKTNKLVKRRAARAEKKHSATERERETGAFERCRREQSLNYLRTRAGELERKKCGERKWHRHKSVQRIIRTMVTHAHGSRRSLVIIILLVCHVKSIEMNTLCRPKMPRKKRAEQAHRRYSAHNFSYLLHPRI